MMMGQCGTAIYLYITKKNLNKAQNCVCLLALLLPMCLRIYKQFLYRIYKLINIGISDSSLWGGAPSHKKL